MPSSRPPRVFHISRTSASKRVTGDIRARIKKSFAGKSVGSETYHKFTLVLGHAASGKSAWAEAAAAANNLKLIYIATSRLWDDEMAAKARDHAARRGPDWAVVEEPVDLAGACAARAEGEIVLIDCATMWLTNLVMDEVDWAPATDAWIAAMAASPARFVVVSNDVGGGVTPDNALARRFQRAQGALNQRLAVAADRVVLVTAGLAQILKDGFGDD
ncbi:MAG: bifunctional adenosylcobinamide kinase/adenosylcobinamide-phosphate guanylyltransferase [Pseudomonadota bacterium]